MYIYETITIWLIEMYTEKDFVFYHNFKCLFQVRKLNDGCLIHRFEILGWWKILIYIVIIFPDFRLVDNYSGTRNVCPSEVLLIASYFVRFLAPFFLLSDLETVLTSFSLQLLLLYKTLSLFSINVVYLKSSHSSCYYFMIAVIDVHASLLHLNGDT